MALAWTNIESAPGRQALRFVLLARTLWVLIALLLLWQMDVHLGMGLLRRPSVMLVLSVMSALTLLSALHLLARLSPVSSYELLTHLLFDIALMSLLLWQTGGATNPFVFWFLVPVSLGALMLPWPQVVVLWAAAVLAYSRLMVDYRPIVPLDMMGAGMQAMNSSYGWHLRGMALDFFLSVSLMAGLGAGMRSAMQRTAAELAQQRELSLRNEHIVALGTLAAGAAHGLGTPLNTMALLVDEMNCASDLSVTMREDLQILVQQLDLCRHLLADVRAQAQWQSEHGRLPLSRALRDICEAAVLMHPALHWDLPSACELSGQLPVGVLPVLMNLMHNAARVARSQVRLRCAYEAQAFLWTLEDDGPGLDPRLRGRLGRRPLPSADGMGVGWLVSQAAIERLGGQLLLQTGVWGGACVQVSLPLEVLLEPVADR